MLRASTGNSKIVLLTPFCCSQRKLWKCFTSFPSLFIIGSEHGLVCWMSIGMFRFSKKSLMGRSYGQYQHFGWYCWQPHEKCFVESICFLISLKLKEYFVRALCFMEISLKPRQNSFLPRKWKGNFICLMQMIIFSSP